MIESKAHYNWSGLRSLLYCTKLTSSAAHAEMYRPISIAVPMYSGLTIYAYSSPVLTSGVAVPAVIDSTSLAFSFDSPSPRLACPSFICEHQTYRNAILMVSYFSALFFSNVLLETMCSSMFLVDSNFSLFSCCTEISTFFNRSGEALDCMCTFLSCP